MGKCLPTTFCVFRVFRGHKPFIDIGVAMKKIWIALPLTIFALSACVTINIYFPAAAAEKAADMIIDEVWKNQNPAQSIPNQTQPAVKETK